MAQAARLTTVGALNHRHLSAFEWLCWERYEIKLLRDRGVPPPWTEDPILARYHFCNVFRRDDRTSVAIYDQIRRAPTVRKKLMAAITGRLVNRAESVAPVVECVLTADRQGLVARLDSVQLNPGAYKVVTPSGLFSREGIATLILTARADHGLGGKLQEAKTLREAHERLCAAVRVGPFIGNQIALDLLECGFWPDTFDGSWVHPGLGSFRGSMLIGGLTPSRTSNASDYYAPHKYVTAGWVLEVIERTTAHVRERWPSDWPEFTAHATQTMLCEYDKYDRKHEGHKSGRLAPGVKRW